MAGTNDKQMRKFGRDEVPYEVFTLRHRPNKTKPNYFKIILKHFKLNFKDIIYFEHDENAVKRAQSVGITTFHYNKAPKDIATLEKFIKQNLQDLN